MVSAILYSFFNLLFRLVIFVPVSMNINRVVAGLDLKRFDAIAESYKKTFSKIKFRQHFNLREHLRKKMHLIYNLKLHRCQPLDILDIGTGTGYFPFLCNRFGHRTTAIDLADIPMKNDLIEYFNVSRLVWQVKTFEQLPDLGRRFDLITAIAICFNNHKTNEVWGVKEWEFFLRDLATHQLNDRGRVFLSLNSEQDGTYYTPELVAYFKRMGARVAREQICFSTMSAFKKQ